LNTWRDVRSNTRSEARRAAVDRQIEDHSDPTVDGQIQVNPPIEADGMSAEERVSDKKIVKGKGV
jgi:hypothetical protein